MKQLVILLIGFPVAIVSSCTNDKTIVPQPIFQCQIQNFPNHIGDWWTYRLTDLNGDTDTIKVEIMAPGILPNGDNANIWRYTFQYASHTDFRLLWVSCIDDTVRIYNSTCWTCTDPSKYEHLRYIFPLTIGDTWSSNPAIGDAMKVLSEEAVSVPAGTFTNVFRLSYIIPYAVHHGTYDTIYFKDQVGIIKLNQLEYDFGPVVTGNGVWELISYNVQ